MARVFPPGAAQQSRMRDFALSAADQDGDQLRGFVLDHDVRLAERFGFGDVAGENTACRGEKAAGFEFDPLRIQFGFGGWGAKADCRGGDALIVAADLGSGGESVMVDPALD